MPGLRKRGELIRRFILDNVSEYPRDIAAKTASHFDITRQSVNKHIKRLCEQKDLLPEGKGRNKFYRLHHDLEWDEKFVLDGSVTEDVIWRDYVSVILEGMPDNVIDIWQYGVTELFNNAIDHSEGSMAYIGVKKSALETEIILSDNGVGIFKKIKNELGLLDERHAVLELAKGKFTTDPDNHSGEGIFFSSRMFDDFIIISGNVYFSHEFGDDNDWIYADSRDNKGTYIKFKLANNTSRTLRKIFDDYTSKDDYGFSKTVVPVALAQYGDDKLVSRSQAKRMLSRIDRFKRVIFDFENVDSIGQAFADEVFRVFKSKHNDIEITFTEANESVNFMIQRALAKD